MATVDKSIDDLIAEYVPGTFKPHCFLSKESDSLTIYFKGDADYSERLTDHVTIYRSIETRELVGCRIKGYSEIVADLPNSIKVSHGDIGLDMIFYSFRSDPKLHDTFKKLKQEVGDLKIQDCVTS